MKPGQLKCLPKSYLKASFEFTISTKAVAHPAYINKEDVKTNPRAEQYFQWLETKFERHIADSIFENPTLSRSIKTKAEADVRKQFATELVTQGKAKNQSDALNKIKTDAALQSEFQERYCTAFRQSYCRTQIRNESPNDSIIFQTQSFRVPIFKEITDADESARLHLELLADPGTPEYEKWKHLPHEIIKAMIDSEGRYIYSHFPVYRLKSPEEIKSSWANNDKCPFVEITWAERRLIDYRHIGAVVYNSVVNENLQGKAGCTTSQPLALILLTSTPLVRGDPNSSNSNGSSSNGHSGYHQPSAFEDSADPVSFPGVY
jgi:hypothetical protein